jgi:phage shock protein PspC (stress-responsive transcriptional regulator)
MGPVRADADGARGTTGRSAGDRTAASGQGTAAGGSSFTSKRLYRILDTGVIGGVCSGVAAYLDLDTTIVRIIVALLALFEIVFVHTPFVVLAYLIALFVVPVAGTSEERAAARGIPFNAQQLIDEAKRNFERIGERNWRREHQDRMREWRWAARQHRRAMRWTMHRPPTWPVAYGSQVAAGIMTPVLTLLSVGAFWLTVYAVMSLANTGTIRGWHLPADMPLWLGIVALLFLYGAVVWPLHAARRASYYYLGGPDFARYEAFDGLMSTILAVAIVWAAYHYRPEVREWIRHVPDAWHNVVASFKAST